jgi:hypothetical protein
MASLEPINFFFVERQRVRHKKWSSLNIYEERDAHNRKKNKLMHYNYYYNRDKVAGVHKLPSGTNSACERGKNEQVCLFTEGGVKLSNKI